MTWPESVAVRHLGEDETAVPAANRDHSTFYVTGWSTSNDFG